jgi:alkylation response protein AidB-like acyl-CoA dehydrogenase
MSDLIKRQFKGDTSGLQADMQRALARIRTDVDAATATAEGQAYEPSDPSLWGTPPTTIGEALNRIVLWLNDRHGADMPIGHA